MSVFNDADRVATALDSIRTQTFADWEMIVIDDGSTDSTAEIVDAAAREDERIRVIHQENTGLTRALIRGCREARGSFIARQDADDRSAPERLAKQVALLESEPSIGFVSCWTQYVGPADEPLELHKRPHDAEAATQALLESRQGPPAHGSVIFRKMLYEQVGGYRPEFYFGQDSDLWLRMAECSRIAYVPERLYFARREPLSVSGTMRSIQQQFGLLAHECRQARLEGRSEAPILAKAEALADEVRAPRANGLNGHADASRMEYLIGSRLAQDGDRRAARYLWPVLKRRPWHWKAWIRLMQSQWNGPSPTGDEP